MSKIKEGDLLPAIQLKDSRGNLYDTSKVKGKKNLVLFFYPKDDTPGCTAEACKFRDHYEDFISADTEVVGISSDSEKSHQSFSIKHRLPFPLLSDPEKKARKLLGVPSTLGFLDGRVTYVVDKQGVVRHIFNSQLQATRHIEEALQAIRSLG